jgi:hypothetical protein
VDNVIHVGTVGASSVVVTCLHVAMWLCHLCRNSQGNPNTSLGSLQGLDGYTVVASILAYPGRAGVYTMPTPIADEGLVGLAAVEKPSFIGYIAEGTGAYVFLHAAAVHRASSCTQFSSACDL